MKRLGSSISLNLLRLLLGTYLALGLVYATTIPLFEAPDEQWHFAYVQHIATGQGLPVQTTGQLSHLARQEGSQPPLYYLLAAAATFWIDTSDFPGIAWENPHYGYNVPGIVDDNKNLFIHTSQESFPYHNTALAVHLARLVSLSLGALAIYFTYRLTLELMPGRESIAASAAALVAFVPQFLLVSNAVSNDSAIVAASALSLWLLVRLARAGAAGTAGPRAREVAVIGIVAGLAALAKVSGLAIIALAIVVLVFVERRHARRLVLHIPLLLAGFGLVAGWWYLRNWLLYGEWTGTEMMLRIFGARQSPLTFAQLLTQLGEVWETFWIGFGWGNIRAQPPVYVALALLVAFSALGILVGLFRQRRNWPAGLEWGLPFGILTLWAAIVFVSLLRWMMLTQAPHGRLLFPALPALMPLALVGLAQLAPRRWRPLLARGIAFALFALAACAPFLILAPAYAYPPSLDDQALGSITHRVDLNYDDKLKLLGYDLIPTQALPGGALELDLYWQALAEMDRDYSIGIHLLAPDGHVIGARDSYPGHGTLPTRLWHAGQVIRDTYWVPVAADATAPGIAQIQVAVYDRSDKSDLTAFDPNGETVTPLIGRFKLAAINPALVRAQYATQYTFGNAIELTGYDLKINRSLDLALYWKPRVPIDVDYTIFVHVLDAKGKIISQRDQQPQDGANPTSLWSLGEQIVDSYKLDLPPDAPAASQIEVGIYRAENGARMPVVDADGHALGDHVVLSLQ